MNDPVIRVSRLGKRYRIGRRRRTPGTGPERLRRWARAPLGYLFDSMRGPAADEVLWAIRDISFEVGRGEVMGIIGRNGAGKSTLLRILSRITEPTEGRAEIHGRVGSLLEVGTGFNPELTGRENIFLNGAVLGMRRAEIAARFDEIVAFAGVDRFVDTPVKRYSSGMRVRLGFAVAAHLNPEVLIIDEVLAVGDVGFQKKCIRKMDDVAQSGRTVLFVSHNMSAIRSLCRTCCLIDEGRLVVKDAVEPVVDAYERRAYETKISSSTTFARPPGALVWMEEARVLCGGDDSGIVPMGSSVAVEVRFGAERPIRTPRLGVAISTHAGAPLINTNNRFLPTPEFERAVRSGRILCRFGDLPLVPGRYFVSLWLGDEAGDFHVEMNRICFDVQEIDLWGTGKSPKSPCPLWWPAEFEFLDDGGPGD